MTSIEQLRAINAAAAAIFTDAPRRTSANAYLHSRGIDASTLAPEWAIGYAPPGWTALVDRLSAQFSEAALLDSGLAQRSTRGWLIDTFRDRVIVGVHNADGVVAGFVGRDLSGGARAPKYLNTRRTELFDKSSLLFGLWECGTSELVRNIVVVEGPLDALAIASRSTSTLPVATCGTAFTDPHAHMIGETAARLGADVVIAMDADSAGREAALRIGEKLHIAGVPSIGIADLPPGTDPAEYLASPVNSVSAVMPDRATPLFTAQVENAISAQGDHMQWIEGRLNAARMIARSLTTYPVAFVARQAGWVADVLDLDVRTVEDEFLRAYAQPDPRVLTPHNRAVDPPAISA